MVSRGHPPGSPSAARDQPLTSTPASVTPATGRPPWPGTSGSRPHTRPSPPRLASSPSAPSGKRLSEDGPSVCPTHSWALNGGEGNGRARFWSPRTRGLSGRRLTRVPDCPSPPPPLSSPGVHAQGRRLPPVHSPKSHRPFTEISEAPLTRAEVGGPVGSAPAREGDARCPCTPIPGMPLTRRPARAGHTRSEGRPCFC